MSQTDYPQIGCRNCTSLPIQPLTPALSHLWRCDWSSLRKCLTGPTLGPASWTGNSPFLEPEMFQTWLSVKNLGDPQRSIHSSFRFPSGHQTWLEHTQFSSMIFHTKLPFRWFHWGISQLAMFEDTGGYPTKYPVDRCQLVLIYCIVFYNLNIHSINQRVKLLCNIFLYIVI